MENIPEDQLTNILEILQYVAALAVGYIMRLFQKKRSTVVGDQVLKAVEDQMLKDKIKI